MPTIDSIELYRHLRTYGVRLNGMRYPIDLLAPHGHLVSTQPLPIALVLRVDAKVLLARYSLEVAPPWRDDDAMISHLLSVITADIALSHNPGDVLTPIEDEDGLSPYVGSLSRQTLLLLQRRQLNATGMIDE